MLKFLNYFVNGYLQAKSLEVEKLNSIAVDEVVNCFGTRNSSATSEQAMVEH